MTFKGCLQALCLLRACKTRQLTFNKVYAAMHSLWQVASVEACLGCKLKAFALVAARLEAKTEKRTSEMEAFIVVLFFASSGCERLVKRA